MTERASTNPSGGVRNLLARFEAKTESTPPPSRGRSPASSERGRSTSSRPLSKVRTSFVAVERSGQMGPMLGVRKHSDAEMTPMANGNTEIKETPAKTEDGHKQGATTNEITNAEAVHSTNALPDVAEEDIVNRSKEETPTSNETKDVQAHSASQIASKDGAEDVESTNTSEASPLARKSAPTNTMDAVGESRANVEDEKNVGSILKGSPFEEHDSQPKANGSPKKDTASKKSPAKMDSPKRPGIKERTSQTTKPFSSNKSSSATKPTTSHLTPINTKNEGPTSTKAPLSAKSGESKSSPKVSGGPKTPSTSASRESAAKTTSPRQPVSKSSPKPVSKSSPKPASKDRTVALAKPAGEGSKKQPSRASMTNGTTSGTTKPPTTTSDPMKKTASTASKPRPKSPTRPTRLPAAATSSTAASAAKLGGPPSRSPSRASTTATARKPPGTKRDIPTTKSRPMTGTESATTQARKKAARPSLPPQTHDRPKTRTSIAPDESFLARMMRPTAASASKVHDKIDTKSPPRKASGTGHTVMHPVSHTVKPKRKSEVMGDVKDESKSPADKENDGENAKNGPTDPKEAEAAQVIEPQTADLGEPVAAEPIEPAADSRAGSGESLPEDVPKREAVEANEPKAANPAESEAIPT